MTRHSDFILSPITNILKEVTSANSGIGNGIETYPLSEYILQATFLKMTGFQEQKLKCICWDLATSDYEYRYLRFTQKPLGECSSYDEKKIIYKDLIELIRKYKPNFDVSNELDKKAISATTVAVVKTIFSASNLSSWEQRHFLDFISDSKIMPETQFATSNNLFENLLQDKYRLLYNHRNRSAHNTQSYQQNLPTLQTLLSPNNKYDNYFVRFALLILLDKIFVRLYEIYQALLDEN